jgi:hypothetical protein
MFPRTERDAKAGTLPASGAGGLMISIYNLFHFKKTTTFCGGNVLLPLVI